MRTPAVRGEHHDKHGRQKKPREIVEEESGRRAETGGQPPKQGGRSQRTPSAGQKTKGAHGERHRACRGQGGGVENGQQIEQHSRAERGLPPGRWCHEVVEGDGRRHGEERPEEGGLERPGPGPARAQSHAHGGGAGTVEISHRGRVAAEREVGAGRREVLRRQPEPAQNSQHAQQNGKQNSRTHAGATSCG